MSTFSLRSTICAGALALLASTASAQGPTPSPITGRVVDTFGAPIAAAVVTMATSATGQTDATTTTDTEGRFSLPGRATGTAVVRVNRIGFAPASRTLPPGSTQIGDIELTVAEFREDVSVTASRGERDVRDVAASVSRVSMTQLQNNGFFAAADEFRGQPGVFFRRGEGDNEDFLFVNVRGVTGNHGNDTFLALVDGIPFISADEEVFMGDLPYDAVGDIELVRGPVSALYGRGGIAGAVNYLTRNVGRTGGLLRTEVASGTYLKGLASFDRAWGGRHHFFGSLAGLKADGWREQNARDSVNLFAKQVSRLGTSSALTVWGNFLDKRYETGSPLPLQADGTPVNVRGGVRSFNGSRDTANERRMFWAATRLDHQVTSRLTVQATAHLRRLKSHANLDFYDYFGFQPDRNVMTVNGFNSRSNEQTVFAEGVATLSLPAARLMIGGNLERTDMDEVERWSGQNGFTFDCGFTFFAIEVDYTTGQVVNGDHPCFERDLVRTIADTTNRFGSAFAQAEINIGSRALLSVGGRYDRFGRRLDITAGTPLVTGDTVNRTLDTFNPKASLTVKLSGNHTVYGAFGQGFNTNFGPAWQWDPSLYIRREKPTTLRNYEVGLKGNVGGSRLSYGVSAFRIDQKDRLIFVSNPDATFGSGLPETIATTGQKYESRGLEVTAKLRPRTGTTIDMNYGWTDATWKELIVDTFGGPLDLSGTTPTGVPPHVFSASIDQAVGDRVSFRLGVEAYSDYFFTQDNAFKGGAYHLVNAGVTWRPGVGKLDQLNLAVTNLLDRDYFFLFGVRDQPTSAVPGVPLQVRLSADWRF